MGALHLIFGNILQACNILRVKNILVIYFICQHKFQTWTQVSHSDILKMSNLCSGNAHCVKLHWPATYQQKGQSCVVTQRSLLLELIVSVAVPSADWPPREAERRLFQLISYPFTKGRKTATVLLKSETNFWGNGAYYFVTNSAILAFPYCLFPFCLYSLHRCSYIYVASFFPALLALCGAQAAFLTLEPLVCDGALGPSGPAPWAVPPVNTSWGGGTSPFPQRALPGTSGTACGQKAEAGARPGIHLVIQHSFRHRSCKWRQHAHYRLNPWRISDANTSLPSTANCSAACGFWLGLCLAGAVCQPSPGFSPRNLLKSLCFVDSENICFSHYIWLNFS